MHPVASPPVSASGVHHPSEPLGQAHRAWRLATERTADQALRDPLPGFVGYDERRVHRGDDHPAGLGADLRGDLVVGTDPTGRGQATSVVDSGHPGRPSGAAEVEAEEQRLGHSWPEKARL